MPGTRHAALTVSGVSAGIVLALWLSGLTKPEGRRARWPAAFASDKDRSGSHVLNSSRVADSAGDAGPSFLSAVSHILPAQTSMSNSGSGSSKSLELPEGVERYSMTPRPHAAGGSGTASGGDHRPEMPLAKELAYYSASSGSSSLHVPIGVEQIDLHTPRVTPDTKAAANRYTMAGAEYRTPAFSPDRSPESLPLGASHTSVKQQKPYPAVPQFPFPAPGSDAPKEEATRQ